MTETPVRSYLQFGLFVTGKGERDFAHTLFRECQKLGYCHFSVIRKIDQRSPITSPKRLKMAGTNKSIPNKDQDQIGLPTRNFLRKGDHYFAILLDDLESRDPGTVFLRYRKALDTILPKEMQSRASVHFLVPMLETYYFADIKTTNAVLSKKWKTTPLTEPDSDVETPGHPKNQLKKQTEPPFREIEDGKEIVRQLDIPYILRNPQTCRALRTLFRWCFEKLGEPLPHFCQKELYETTKGQLDAVSPH